MMFVSNHRFPRHSHDQFGIGVLESGGQVSWSGAGTVRALPGDIIMVNPGEIHDGASVDGTPREWKILYLDPAVINREADEDFIGPAEIVRPVASDPLLSKSLLALFGCLANRYSEALEVEEKFIRSVTGLFRRHGVARFVANDCYPSVLMAVERIEADPTRSPSLTELASLAGLSRFQLVRAFSRTMGITPHAYLIQRRVLLAQRLLRKGQTAAQAALESGFSDQSHLSRAFVRQVGVTPGCYRSACIGCA